MAQYKFIQYTARLQRVNPRHWQPVQMAYPELVQMPLHPTILTRVQTHMLMAIPLTWVMLRLMRMPVQVLRVMLNKDPIIGLTLNQIMEMEI